MNRVPIFTADPDTGETRVTYPSGQIVPITGLENGLSNQGGNLSGGTPGHGTQPTAGLQSPPAPTNPVAVDAETPEGTRADQETPWHAARRYEPGGTYDVAQGAEFPQFGDRTTHPWAGGGPRTPGGPAATGTGGDFREQVTQYDTGASAGPFGVRSPRQPAQPARGGNANDANGGGGSGASSLYYRVRDRLTGAGSGDPGYSTSYSSSGYEPPKEEKPKKINTRYGKFDEAQAASFALDPSILIPAAQPGIDPNNPRYGRLAELDAYTLGVLGDRGWKGNAKSTVNAIGQFYEDAGNTGDLPDQDQMLRNLFDPKKGKGVWEMFEGQKSKDKDSPYEYEYGYEPPAAGDASNTLKQMARSVYESTMVPIAADARSAWTDFLIGEAARKDARKPAGKGKPIFKQVGRQLGV